MVIHYGQTRRVLCTAPLMERLPAAFASINKYIIPHPHSHARLSEDTSFCKLDSETLGS